MSDTPQSMSEAFNLPPGSFVRHIKEVEASGMSAEEVSMMGGIEGVLRFRLEQVTQLKDQLAALQARYNADIAMMNERLQERTETMLARLQAKTQREGFVPVEAVDRLIERLTLWSGAEDSSDGSRAYENAIEFVKDFLKPNEEP